MAGDLPEPGALRQQIVYERAPVLHHVLDLDAGQARQQPLYSITPSANDRSSKIDHTVWARTQSLNQWKPPLEDYWCTYARMWIRDKPTWGLSVTSAGQAALTDMLDRC